MDAVELSRMMAGDHVAHLACQHQGKPVIGRLECRQTPVLTVNRPGGTGPGPDLEESATNTGNRPIRPMTSGYRLRAAVAENRSDPRQPARSTLPFAVRPSAHRAASRANFRSE